MSNARDGGGAFFARVRPKTIRTATGSLLGAISAVGVVIGVTMLTGGQALASPTPTPSTVPGNVPPGQANVCELAGLSGVLLFGGLLGGDVTQHHPEAGSGTIHTDGTMLNVTINAGWTASGIVVKGGNSQHVYHGPFVGLDTITNMTAPPKDDGSLHEISHWFVCGDETPTPTPTDPGTTEPPTTEPPTTEPPTTEPPTTEPPTTEPPTTEPPTTEPPTTEPPTTEPPATTPVVTTTPTLPTTGGSLTGILVTGSSLLLGGIALLIVLSARRRTEDNTAGIA